MKNQLTLLKKSLPVLAGTMAVALLAACGSTASSSAVATAPAPASSVAAASSAASQAPSAVASATPSVAPAAAPAAGDIGIAKAREIALQHAGVATTDAAFTKEAPDKEDGMAVYDIEFVAGNTQYKYEIAAADGSVRESSQEAVAGGNVATTGQISAEQAKAAALGHAGLTEAQVTITKLALEHDDGRAEYDVEFAAGGIEYSYTIDAVSGAILEADQDRD